MAVKKQSKVAYEPHRFPYKWYLKDGYPAPGIEAHGMKVFGTFICGGGSSMGYKLAGYHHLGGVELDPKIAKIYEQNHHPEHLYNMDIRDFNKLEDLPAELYQLDLLDGSPPCSTFSTAGARENGWGKEKKFAEGQKLQTLDDLVFVYCDTIEKLMPKCCLLENVSGLVKGNAKSYAKAIMARLNEIGYDAQVFLLNGATMGVPQVRERVFFVGHKKEYDYLPKLKLQFNEEPIKFGEFAENEGGVPISDHLLALWNKRIPRDTKFADINIRVNGSDSLFSNQIMHQDRVLNTLCASGARHTYYERPMHMTDNDMLQASSFPMDYNWGGQDSVLQFLTGMSVPPLMTAQIAYQIYKQWLSKIR